VDIGLLERAFSVALAAHGDTERKGSGVPYLAHLLAVAAMVVEHGGSDVQVAAALLHDAAEDGGGRAMLARIRAEVGSEVARLVEALSDSLVDTTAGEEKAPWLTRKARYVRRLAHEPREALLVCVADKLHNARALLDAYRAEGEQAFQRFNEPDPAGQLWYFQSLADVLAARLREEPAVRPLADELRSTVETLAAELRRAHPGIDDRARAFAVQAAAVPDE
jgi:(p)ppGpp synthase/HD superfamily hydrolase